MISVEYKIKGTRTITKDKQLLTKDASAVYLDPLKKPFHLQGDREGGVDRYLQKLAMSYY